LLLAALSPAAGCAQTHSQTRAPLPGAPSAVADPAGDADVRAAANAMLGALPVRDARLDRIEAASRQIVAGQNYRLTVRLADGSRWSAVVWHKLDGSFVTSEITRVR
jgi:hypothetical protein